MLLLSETLMLTALHDNKGTIVFAASSSFPFALAGAVLMDLFFARAIDLGEKHLTVNTKEKNGDPILDTALELILKINKEKSVKYWINRLGNNIKSVKNAVLKSLVSRDILFEERGKILYFFPITRYKTKNPAVENELRTRLRSIVLFGDFPSERDTVLLSLIGASNLIRELFDKSELKAANARIKQICSDTEIGKTVSAVVIEMQAAVAGAVAAVSAASASSS